MSSKRSKARCTRVMKLWRSVSTPALALEESKPQDHDSELFSDIPRGKSESTSSPSVRSASPERRVSVSRSVSRRIERKTRFCRTWANLTAAEVLKLGVDKTSLHSVSERDLIPDRLPRQGPRTSSTEVSSPSLRVPWL